MDERERRIVDTAMELAEKGGFEAVRLRDVAANADVALGTLYRHFRSKEDLLVAALSQETSPLVKKMRKSAPKGDTALERIDAYFTAATRTFCRRAKLARAVLRAAASGEPGPSAKLERFHDLSNGMLLAAIRGRRLGENDATEEEATVAGILQQVWFASLIGWMGGSLSEKGVVAEVGKAAAYLLREGTAL
jgi:AcrR family transcriptional regulator